MATPPGLTRPGRLLATLAVLAMAAALIYRWGHGLTGDEPVTANRVRLPWRELWAIFRIDNVPLYYAALKIWSSVAGESEVALRSLSAAAFGAGVWFTGAAAARVGGTTAGAAAALLLAASDRIGLENAATARTYALVGALTAAAMFQSLRLLDRGPAPRARGTPAFLLLTATHVAAMFAHPTYVAMAATFAAAAVIAERRVASPLVLAPVAATFLYTLLWGPMALATIALGTTAWMQPPTFAEVRYSFFLQWGSGPAFLMAGALLASLLRSRAETGRAAGDRAIRWLVAAAALGWVMPLAISAWQPIFKPAHTPVMLLPAMSAAVAALLARLGGRRVALALAACAVLAALHRTSTVTRLDVHPSSRSLSQLLDTMRCDDTLVGAGLAAGVAEYYFRRLGAPSCVRVVAFPGDVEAWVQRWGDDEARRQLQTEAVTLARELSGRRATAWLLTLGRPDIATEASPLIAGAVRAVMTCDDAVPLAGAFFDAVTRCTPVRQTR